MEKAHYPVTVLCRTLEASRSGYYAWRRRPVSDRAKEDLRLITKIRAVHKGPKRCYGSPRMHRELVEGGDPVGRHRVARLMREDGIVGRPRRKFRKTTQSNHRHPIAPNLLNRDFRSPAPDRVWVGDITFVRTGEGWLYLAVLLDLFSRRVVGWATSRRINRGLTIAALHDAIQRRHPKPGLIHHSDRGSQYASGDYQKLLWRFRMTASMSRKGDCWDNAVAESFFGSLEQELLLEEPFATRNDAKHALFNYIERFYNSERRHSYLGYSSPIDYERRALLLTLAA